ncbi:Myb_DNA-bind_4 domain-containing protein [Cephalotus follicularis]|uniref:Myb_DNA-bind_4 domain-containing protein n=1 Tax=Cephalotus follicularis TaxID=3775 RepID=A0A1Q3BRY4_CEPFO|nr:Myb_DNA-bind_4 domain-containing protein [Cephalotus follicularis]
MATPSPSPSPPPPQSPSSNPKPVPIKKPQPIPWTHRETINLIQAYQEKWYSLKRGQLKASQWEEVAANVSAKCGYDGSSSQSSAKSALQCRHKMEKLRKRYRSEKQAGATISSTSWQYFHLMECLDRGPLPISSRPMEYINEDDDDDDDGDNDNDDVDNEIEDDEDDSFIKSRSINYILRRPTFVNRFSSGIMRGGGGGGMVKRARIAVEEEVVIGREEEEEERERVRGRRVGMELAAEIRGFAERFVGMEKNKIEMIKEMERCRMEMEDKRIKMIMDSQRKIVDMIDMAFGSQNNNKVKVEQKS